MTHHDVMRQYDRIPTEVEGYRSNHVHETDASTQIIQGQPESQIVEQSGMLSHQVVDVGDGRFRMVVQLGNRRERAILDPGRTGIDEIENQLK